MLLVDEKYCFNYPPVLHELTAIIDLPSLTCSLDPRKKFCLSGKEIEYSDFLELIPLLQKSSCQRRWKFVADKAQFASFVKIEVDVPSV